jgi:hypothetical protein
LIRQEDITVWHDRLLVPGKPWHPGIENAIANARAAVLLLGPAFLGSEFIAEEELPLLFKAEQAGRLLIFPLVVAYCHYARNRLLGPVQAFNDPNTRLEALPEPEQNRILKDLSAAVARAVAGPGAAVPGKGDPGPGLEREARLFNLPHLHNPFFTGRESALRVCPISGGFPKLLG